MEGGCPNSSNQNQNHTGYQQMIFTNTDCVLKNWRWYKVFSRFTWQAPNQVLSQLNDQVLSQVSDQVNDQLDDQVIYQISPIKSKIHKEIKK
jgi:hypothetical protein